MSKDIFKLLSVSILFLLSGCAAPPALVPSEAVIVRDTGPQAQVTVLVAPPPGTSSSASIALLLLDPIAGLDIQTVQTMMSPRNDGRFEAQLTVPVGSILTYRYLLLQPNDAVEAHADGVPVRSRVLYVPGPTQVEETIAAWAGTPSPSPVGRIIGRVLRADNGKGQRELLVSAGGKTVWTESGGSFRIDGLPEGLHNITVFSHDGAFSAVSQGALVGADVTTPVELQAHPAKPIFVTFQLTVPEGLSPDAVLRLAGNVSTLGNRLSELMGGMRISTSHMPTMVKIDPLHYLAVLSLYSGTDLRYKYTLGDGLWNAERNADGALLSRQVILPDEDIVLRDQVALWGSPATPPVRLIVNVPENTPDDDTVSLQLNPFQWFEPLPMWQLDESTWYYDLYGPLDKGLDLQYRYCRNQQCGQADDVDTFGLEAGGRSLSYEGQSEIIHDDVRNWKWLEDPPVVAQITAEPVAQSPYSAVGVELSRYTGPDGINGYLPHIQSLGADSLIFPLTWQWQSGTLPLLGFDPASSPLGSELLTILMATRHAGMHSMIKLDPVLSQEFWDERHTRDRDWWQHWFDEYHSFALTAGEMSSEFDVEVLILGGLQATPALPGGKLAAGAPSGVPEDADRRWRTIIADVRTVFTGLIAFELVVDAEGPEMPEFMDDVDVILLDWRLPLIADEPLNASQLALAAAPMLDSLEHQAEQFKRPLWIIVEYASVQGGAAACPPAPDGSCRPVDGFSRGQDPDPDLSIDFQQQTTALNAVLLATSNRPAIQGFFVNGYDPSALLWDKSTSLYGKPAEEVLRYWYPLLRGE